MMQADRFDVFAESMAGGETSLLRALEKEALEEGIPIIRPRIRGLIRFLLVMRRPARILEIGTATGFSALVMYTCAKREGFPCSITTIERDPDRAQKARANFKRAGAEGIRLLEGDAQDLLKVLEGPFDMIFLDAAKGQYIHFLPVLLDLLGERGVLLSDNVLRGGEILDSRYTVTRRNRTIHARMREYLRALHCEPSLQTVLLEMEDGAAVSVRRESQNEQ